MRTVLARSASLTTFLVASAVALAACGAGPYGHAPHYVPASDEASALQGAREYDPVMFQRQPEEWQKSPISLFGIVSRRSPGPGGAAELVVSVRRLEPRNLCESMRDDSTCRVTVSDREFGFANVLVALRPDDDVGERSVGVGSLVRVVATGRGEVDPQGGAPILRATFYRHWPRNYYVTKSAARDMRQ